MIQNSGPFIEKKKLIQKAIFLNSLAIMIFSINGFFTGENHLYRIAIWLTITFALIGYAIFIKIVNLKVLIVYMIVALTLIGYNYYLLSKVKI